MLVLHAPIPVAVKVNTSDVQLLLSDWYKTGVPTVNIPTPEEVQF